MTVAWRSRLAGFLFYLLWSLFFVAFAHGEEQQSADSVIATVDGVVITKTEYERMLRLSLKAGVTDKATDEFKKVLLEGMINGILIDKYLSETGALQSQELKDEIKLARLSALKNYLSGQIVAATKPPTQADIEKFVAEHPDFFKDRKIYHYTDLIVKKEARIDVSRIKAMAEMANKNTKPIQADAIKDDVLNDIGGYLVAVGADLTQFRGNRSSEQIQEDLLKDLKGLQPGQVLVDDKAEKNVIHVLALFSVTPDPMDPARARVQIAKGIMTKQALEKYEYFVQQLRESKEIKFGKDVKGLSPESPRKPTESLIRGLATFGALKNIWIFSLVLLLPASMLHLHRLNLTKKSEALPYEDNFTIALSNRLASLSVLPAFEYSLAGICVLFFGYTSFLLFHTNGFVKWLPILIEVAISMIASLAMIFALKKWSNFLPGSPRSRFLPLFVILSVQLGLLFAS